MCFMKSGNRFILLTFVVALFCVTNPIRAEQLHGVVVNEDGKPVAHADVRLLKRGTSWSTPGVRVSSQDDGTFAFDKLSAGEYRIWAFAGDLTSRGDKFK